MTSSALVTKRYRVQQSGRVVTQILIRCEPQRVQTEAERPQLGAHPSPKRLLTSRRLLLASRAAAASVSVVSDANCTVPKLSVEPTRRYRIRLQWPRQLHHPEFEPDCTEA